MEKYGVCKTCHGRPTGPDDMEGFTKTASGELACTNCGQTIMKIMVLEDKVTVKDTLKK